MKNFFKEFKDFINRGNVVDMAVGVIIGGAFGKIVTALVNNVVTPAISLLTGKVNIAELNVTVPASVEGAEPIVISYGLFIQAIIDFLIIALCVFFFVKLISKLKKKKEEEPAAPAEPPAPSNEEVLLAEIRDLLKGKE